jgi:U3 small nucleolar RNA-associated protein 20
MLGPSYLPIILGEMRGALTRGPQLHVLAYVTHALLVHVTKEENVETFRNLDNCVEDVAHISVEVIFGEPGKDVQSEDFKTKMREVRSSGSKGFDSLGIIAKFISPPKISSLLRPLRAIMQESETLKVMLKVDDALRRIAGGLNSNDHLVPKELIVLCHTLISQNSKLQKDVVKVERKRKRAKEHAIVERKGLPEDADGHFTVNSFRCAAVFTCSFSCANVVDLVSWPLDSTCSTLHFVAIASISVILTSLPVWSPWSQLLATRSTRVTLPS